MSLSDYKFLSRSDSIFRKGVRGSLLDEPPCLPLGQCATLQAPATEPACPFWPPELCLEEVRRANSSPDAHRDPLSRVVLLGHAAFLEGGWRPMWQGDPRRLPYSPGSTSVPRMEYQATIQASAVVCRAVFSRMGTATLLAVCVNNGPVFKTTLLSLPGLTPFLAQDKAVLREAWNQVVDHVVSPARLTGLRLAGGEPLTCLSGLQLTSVLPLMTQLEVRCGRESACSTRCIYRGRRSAQPLIVG